MPEPVEPIKRAIVESAEQRSDQRLGLTARRAAILAAVVCVLTLTIAGPVRTYFAQRTEMKQLAASEAALRQQIADLQQQKVKLADPAYIAAQARERLGFVKPGDIPYQVQLPPSAAVARGAGKPADARGHQRPVVHVAVAHHRRYPARPADAGPAGTCPPAGARPGRVRCRPVVDRDDLDAVARQLGREPRGVLQIAYRCPNGEPGVVKTAPKLPDGTPFPTLYYLTHPVLTAAASRLESTGMMREMTAAAARANPNWPPAIDGLTSHTWPSGTPSSHWGRRFPAGGMPDRVKCLHVLIAHSLAKGRGANPLGDEALAVLAVEPSMAGILDPGEWT